MLRLKAGRACEGGGVFNVARGQFAIRASRRSARYALTRVRVRVRKVRCLPLPAMVPYFTTGAWSGMKRGVKQIGLLAIIRTRASRTAAGCDESPSDTV
ncbi:hypothetical protein GCM10017687_82540 [Streptomyces echinatus]